LLCHLSYAGIEVKKSESNNIIKCVINFNATNPSEDGFF
jgi:hypothetical protein